jgi:hypothetical protein
MLVKIRLASLSQDHWYDYAIRFALGGLATVVAGIVADLFGPSLGGLMLAFPAIFVASATLIERNERHKKEKAGLKGSARGRMAAALDSVGAGWGSVALFAFALIVTALAAHGAFVSLGVALAAWCVVAVTAWYVRRSLRRAA